MLRTVLAVVAGYIASTILTITVFALLSAFIGEYAYQIIGVLVGLVVFGVFSAMAGGWVAARVAENRPAQHAIYLGAVMFVFGVLSFMSPAAGEPLWFKLALIVVALPSAWLGGLIREKQSLKSAAATPMASSAHG